MKARSWRVRTTGEPDGGRPEKAGRWTGAPRAEEAALGESRNSSTALANPPAMRSMESASRGLISPPRTVTLMPGASSSANPARRRDR